MTNVTKYAGLVALVILAIIYVPTFFGKSATFGTAVDCQSVTCFTTVGVLTSLQDDGTAIFNGATTLASTLDLTGAATLSSTLSVTATTTLSDTVNFNNPGICLNFYATSTATRMHMTASSTSLVNGVSTGVMLIDYGACAL